MSNITNLTPFSVDHFGMLDQHATQFELIVVNATFEALPGKPVTVAERQAMVRAADEYYGEPGSSSVKYEADIALEKPLVDIIVNGNAHAPGGKPVEKMRVGFQVGRLSKELLVMGDRFWRLGVTGRAPSSPNRFLTMPIIYERAFGGIDLNADSGKQHSDPRNPIGVGFKGAVSQNPDIKTEIPNIEYPSLQVSSVKSKTQPAGFGVIARNWSPRAAFAGTYDEQWLINQSPLLPVDFDNRYFQAVAPDQQMPVIQGGEMAIFLNMTPEGRWGFNLPKLKIPLTLLYSDRSRQVTLRTDTILFEPDQYRFTMTSRVKVKIERNAGPLEEIIIGDVDRGWLRAVTTRKIYQDWSGRSGFNRNAIYYTT